MFTIFKLKPTKYFISVTFSKHGGNYYPRGPKSNSHKGTKISNQYMQFILVNPTCIIEESVERVKEKFPNASNFRFNSIKKL